MQSGNDAKFLNITSLFLSSNRIAAASIPVPVIFIVSFTTIYASLSTHKFNFVFAVLNLIWLLVLQVPRASFFFLPSF